MQLHLLQEAESSYSAVTLTEDARKSAMTAKTRLPTNSVDIPLIAENHFQFWDDRLDRTPPNMATREPILAFRRAIYKLVGAKAAASKTWLAQAKVARSADTTVQRSSLSLRRDPKLACLYLSPWSKQSYSGPKTVINAR